MTAPTPEARLGRRALEGMAGVEILEDLAWESSIEGWVLRLRLVHSSAPTPEVPRATEWYVRIGRHYPLGTIVIAPAAERSLTATFPHQAYNGSSTQRWRQGHLCLDTPAALAGDRAAAEPSTAEARLAWYVARAVAWLDAAASGTLAPPGAPFELPQWPASTLKADFRIAFSEGPDTFGIWKTVRVRCGLVELRTVGGKHLVVQRWCDLGGRTVAETTWGTVVPTAGDPMPGVWLRLSATPYLPPWRGPATWGELRDAAGRSGIRLDDLLEQLATYTRGKPIHVLLVGFPIPTRIGDPESEMHWQAAVWPKLETTGAIPKGYRDNHGGRWARDRRGPLRDDVPLVWLVAENWHRERLGLRGQFGLALRNAVVAVVGCGALGSAIAELLVRCGVEDVLLVDGDELAAGNLRRHTLLLSDLGAHKATALAARLNAVSPHARVRGVDAGYPLDPPAGVALLDRATIVLDCTASDSFLRALSRGAWSVPKLFVSASTGRQAARLFFFAAHAGAFPLGDFRDMVEPWLALEASQAGADDMPWSGAGCWHPLFPARADDVALLAAAAVKLLDDAAREPPSRARLQVFARQQRDGSFAGLEPVELDQRQGTL